MARFFQVLFFAVLFISACATLDELQEIDALFDGTDLDAVEATSLMQSGQATLAGAVMGLTDDPFDDLEDAFDAPKLTEMESAEPAVKVEGAAVDAVYWVKFILDLAIFAIVATIVNKFYAQRAEAEAPVKLRPVCTPVRCAPADFGPLTKALQAVDETAWRQLLKDTPGLAQQEDAWGCTALHVAAQCGSAALVEELLSCGAVVNAREAWEETPLHFAATAGSVEVCKLLFARGADLNARDNSDCTPVLAAGRAGKEASCKYLLDVGGGCGNVADSEMPPLLSALLISSMIAPPPAVAC